EYARSNLFLLLRISTRNEYRGGPVFGTFLVLHRLERNLDTTPARRLVHADDLEIALKEFDRIANVGLARSLPFSVDDRLVTRLELSSLANRDVRDVRVLVIHDAIDQSLSKTRIALIE